MKYSMMAKVLPLVLDKTVYGYLNSDGANITKETKKEIKREYKAMVLRTPGLDKGNSLEKNLYIGCYLLSFAKAAPQIVNEERFSGIIKAMCDEMVRRSKEDDSMFSEKNIRKRQLAAEKSQSSDKEMDWISTFERKNEDHYEFTYSKCGLCELGRREGCFHLIKYLCLTDYISFDLGGAKLVREHTIANGDGYCDFQVYRKVKHK